ncbi:hypothetical protein JKI95_03140 [Corynebacterium aquatimens]|uniref:5-methylcytosine restriction system specificity protein McrC n=1 Tax=Corynebacterium aquatimens TaxID=1190508 RepID=UPI003313A461|nr:hypothetical protein JKI95_03140 [Corynebacterium aquatimens]
MTHPGLLPTRFQEFSTDIPPNRLLKWALNMLRNEVRNSQLLHRMDYQIGRLARVAGQNLPSDLERIWVAPQFKHVEPGLSVAAMLYRQQLASLDARENGIGTDLIWATAPLFEDFTFFFSNWR